MGGNADDAGRAAQGVAGDRLHDRLRASREATGNRGREVVEMSKQETSHTPGPWSAEECRSGFAVYAYKSGDAVVRTEDDEGRYGPIANEANARLIASAPELLDVLKQLIGYMDAGNWADMRIDGIKTAARAAIAKAEGRAWK